MPSPHRLHVAIVLAAGLAITLGASRLTAQQTGNPQQTGTSITVVGCVNRATNNGSLAGGPGVPPATPNDAPVLANSNEPTGAFLLNGVVPAATSATRTDSAPPLSYVLDGSARELEPHVGHQVEVVGTERALNEGAKDAKTTVRHIQVASVKTIAEECPKPQNR